jgi:hypothetical protein
MDMKRRAQGALEFLMTYGWAFLVILIMIGALAYFGILNPTKFLPDKCVFGPPFACATGDIAMTHSATGTVVLKMTNNYGSAIKVFGAAATTDITGGCTADVICVDSADADCGDAGEALGGASNLDGAAAAAYTWAEGAPKKVVVDCTGGGTLPVGDKVKFNLVLSWFPASSDLAYAKPVNGQLYAQIQ